MHPKPLFPAQEILRIGRSSFEPVAFSYADDEENYGFSFRWNEQGYWHQSRIFAVRHHAEYARAEQMMSFMVAMAGGNPRHLEPLIEFHDPNWRFRSREKQAWRAACVAAEGHAFSKGWNRKRREAHEARKARRQKLRESTLSCFPAAKFAPDAFAEMRAEIARQEEKRRALRLDRRDRLRAKLARLDAEIAADLATLAPPQDPTPAMPCRPFMLATALAVRMLSNRSK